MSEETRYRLLSVRYTHTHEKNHPNGGFSTNFYFIFYFLFLSVFIFFTLIHPSLYSSLLNTMHFFSLSHLPTCSTFARSFL